MDERLASATEILRRLLDERGVEYEAYMDVKNRCVTKWRTYHGALVFFAVEKEGKLFVETVTATEHSAICTPEQAIAATLGGVECVPHGEWESISQTQEVRHIFCECGHELGMDRRDSLPFHRTSLCAIPNYCEECGRKIRKAVKR